jgi:hypothetical protein
VNESLITVNGRHANHREDRPARSIVHLPSIDAALSTVFEISSLSAPRIQRSHREPTPDDL